MIHYMIHVGNRRGEAHENVLQTEQAGSNVFMSELNVWKQCLLERNVQCFHSSHVKTWNTWQYHDRVMLGMYYTKKKCKSKNVC